MRKLHALLLSTVILNAGLAIGCAHDDTQLGDEVVLYRQEAAELRSAAQYYETEAQQSAQTESERAQRYRAFAQQAWEQADEADRRADEFSGS